MKNKFLKQAYVSIEVVIVAAVILTAGLCGLLAFVKNAKERNNGMLNAIDDIYAELDKPISGTGGGAGGIGGGSNIVIRPYSANLVTGPEFNASVPEGTTDIVFTDIVAPEGATLTDLSVEQNGSIVAWLDGTTYYVSSQDEMTSISFNEDCSCMFLPEGYYVEEENHWYETSMPYLNSIEFNQVVSTSKVVNMYCMFECQCNLSYLDLTTFDVSNVENMEWMFDCIGCEVQGFVLDLTGWDTSSVTDMEGMFYWCGGDYAYKGEIKGLENFDTSHVTIMEDTFGYLCVKELDLTNWDTRNVENMDYIFYDTCYLEKITFGDNWVWIDNDGEDWPYLEEPSDDYIPGATGYWYDIYGNQYLREEIPNGAGTYYAYPHRCEDKDSNGTCDGCGKHIHLDKNKDDYCDACNQYLMAGDAYAIYTDADKTLRFIRSETALSVGDNYEGKEIAAVYKDFENNEYYYDRYDLSGSAPWIADKQYRNEIQNVIFIDYVRPIDTSGWFSLRYCSNFDVAKLDLSNATDASNTFTDAGYNATMFSLDLSSWDMSNVTNASEMFSYAGHRSTKFLLNLTGWDVSNMIDMRELFESAAFDATTFEIKGLENWDVSSVEDMDGMFAYAGYNATSFEFDFSKWVTSNVKTTCAMFYVAGHNTTTFEIKGLENWDVSSVEDMDGMFGYAGYNATTWSIGDISNWDVSKVTNMYGMFREAGKDAKYTLDLSAWKTKVGNVTSHAYFDTGVENKIISPWD